MDARAGGQTDGQKDGGRSVGTGLTVGMSCPGGLDLDERTGQG